MNEIFPTIYWQCPVYQQEEFMNISPQLCRILTYEENYQMPLLDKWYINLN